LTRNYGNHNCQHAVWFSYVPLVIWALFKMKMTSENFLTVLGKYRKQISVKVITFLVDSKHLICLFNTLIEVL
jgi:hypothetical protein